MHSSLLFCILPLLFLVVSAYSARSRVPKMCCKKYGDINCAPRCVRKSYTDVTSEEWNKLAYAFRVLAESGTLKKLADEHVEHFNVVHNTSLEFFFPYHFLLVREVETLVNSIVPGLCLPYFDYTLEKDYLHRSGILGSDKLGSVPIGKCPACLTDGVFKNLYHGLDLGEPTNCLERCRYSTFKELKAEFDKEFNETIDYDNTIDPPPRYDFMQRTMDINMGHVLIHMLFGGTMFKSSSPLDPAFFFLHSRVEMIHAESLRVPEFRLSRGKFMNMRIPVYDMTIGEAYLLDPCYFYAPVVTPPNPLQESSNADELTHPHHEPFDQGGIIHSVTHVVRTFQFTNHLTLGHPPVAIPGTHPGIFAPGGLVTEAAADSRFFTTSDGQQAVNSSESSFASNSSPPYIPYFYTFLLSFFFKVYLL